MPMSSQLKGSKNACLHIRSLHQSQPLFSDVLEHIDVSYDILTPTNNIRRLPQWLRQ